MSTYNHGDGRPSFDLSLHEKVFRFFFLFRRERRTKTNLIRWDYCIFSFRMWALSVISVARGTSRFQSGAPFHFGSRISIIVTCPNVRVFPIPIDRIHLSFFYTLLIRLGKFCQKFRLVFPFARTFFLLLFFPSFWWRNMYRNSKYSAIRMKLCPVFGQLFCANIVKLSNVCCAPAFGARSHANIFSREINNSCWMSIVNGHRFGHCGSVRVLVSPLTTSTTATMATQLGRLFLQCLRPFAIRNATEECHSPSPPPPIIAAYLSHLSSSRFDVCVTQSFFSERKKNPFIATVTFVHFKMKERTKKRRREKKKKQNILRMCAWIRAMWRSSSQQPAATTTHIMNVWQLARKTDISAGDFSWWYWDKLTAADMGEREAQRERATAQMLCTTRTRRYRLSSATA